jgi:hypothetical protein
MARLILRPLNPKRPKREVDGRTIAHLVEVWRDEETVLLASSYRPDRYYATARTHEWLAARTRLPR